MPSEWDREHNPLFLKWYKTHVHGAKQPRKRVDRALLAMHPEKSKYGEPLQIEMQTHSESMFKYSCAIPTESVLRAISDASPNGILEIGAGAGYWARLLSLLPSDVVAVDRQVRGKSYYSTRLKFPVLAQDGRHVVRDPAHKDRTLFMCWPEAYTSWPVECVRLTVSRTFAYVGTKGFSNTGGVALRSQLRGHWRRIAIHPMPNWYGERTRLEIWERA